MEPGAQARVERRLAAILAADVAGYSRLIEADEEGTLGRLKALRAELIDPKIAGHRGRIVKTTGDGLLVEFASVVDALRCAAEVQAALAEGAAPLPPDHRIAFRIGIHQGDVVVEDGDIFGDGVNVAARLEGLAEPGGICVSARVQEDAAGRLALAFEDIGEQALKNITRPIRVFRVRWESPHPKSTAPLRPSGGRGRGPRSGRVRWAAPRTGTSAPLTPPSPPGRRGERVKSASFEPNFARKPSERFPPESPSRVGAAEPPLALPDKPSIAVLPFSNMSGDPEQEYFADGMVEEIITALSKIRWFFVIARNSTFTYKARAIDVRQVGRDLGVRYVLEGSVRKAGARVRITAQLIDAGNGNHLWAERYDRELADIFAVQDEITERVAAAIEPQLYTAENFRSQRKPPESLDAWDCTIRALSDVQMGTRDGNTRAEALCRRAITIAPSYSQAHSLLAWVLMRRVLWASGYESTLPEAMSEAKAAISFDESDPWAHFTHGTVLWRLRRHGEAERAAHRAVELNPNFALAYCLLGFSVAVQGRPEEAIKSAEYALRLSPKDRLVGRYSAFAMMYAHFAAGRYADSMAWAGVTIERYPEHPWAYAVLVAAAAISGEVAEPHDALTKLHHLIPVFSLAWLRENSPFVGEFAQRLIDGLRKAGMPEK